LIFNDNKYWLNAGNENPDSMFKFTILLEKSTENDDLFISPYKIESPKRCTYCYNPDCGKAKDENGNIFYCSAAKPKPTDENNNTQAKSQNKRRLSVAVERYLLKH
jgi:serine protease inhibitor